MNTSKFKRIWVLPYSRCLIHALRPVIMNGYMGI